MLWFRIPIFHRSSLLFSCCWTKTVDGWWTYVLVSPLFGEDYLVHSYFLDDICWNHPTSALPPRYSGGFMHLVDWHATLLHLAHATPTSCMAHNLQMVSFKTGRTVGQNNGVGWVFACKIFLSPLKYSLQTELKLGTSCYIDLPRNAVFNV